VRHLREAVRPDAAPIACGLTLAAPPMANGLAAPAPTMNSAAGAMPVATPSIPVRPAAMNSGAPPMASGFASRTAACARNRPATRFARKLPAATPAISSRLAEPDALGRPGQQTDKDERRGSHEGLEQRGGRLV
jgi:hypothetical protein